MLYLFHGNSRFLIQKEAQKWKQAFTQKFGAENVTHISSLGDYSLAEIQETLVGRSLFSEKRLVIIDGFPFTTSKTISNGEGVEETILQSLSHVPDEVIIVFTSDSPDKRLSSFKQIQKLAEVKEFTLASESDVLTKLHSEYGNRIDNAALSLLLKLKGGDYQKTNSEIQKLLITIKHIGVGEINTIIIPEFEESIFQFVDAILEKDSQKIFLYLQNLTEFTSIYQLYQSLIANLRVFLYIEHLKHQKIPVQKIGDILKLGNRKFLIQKRHNSDVKSITYLFNELLDFDSHMKRGKLISSDEQDLYKEIEKICIKFLNF
ncbi:hypothetical protein GW846_02650 [Candidatus Gracilibacteria bacterium]|nr:hypothetical protein [Candidatus Gracilibacteria bacterium]